MGAPLTAACSPIPCCSPSTRRPPSACTSLLGARRSPLVARCSRSDWRTAGLLRLQVPLVRVLRVDPTQLLGALERVRRHHHRGRPRLQARLPGVRLPLERQARRRSRRTSARDRLETSMRTSRQPTRIAHFRPLSGRPAFLSLRNPHWLCGRCHQSCVDPTVGCTGSTCEKTHMCDPTSSCASCETVDLPQARGGRGSGRRKVLSACEECVSAECVGAEE